MIRAEAVMMNHCRGSGFPLGRAVAMLLLGQTIAAAQQVQPTQSDAGKATEAENNGQDITRPQSLFQLRYNYSTAPGSGPTKNTTHQVTTDTVTLRMDQRIDLAPQWTVALRA